MKSNQPFPNGDAQAQPGGPRSPHQAPNMITLTAGQTTLTGTSGVDFASLGSAGATVLVSGIEQLTGGAGTDVVTIGASGATMAVTAIETLIGGVGTDMICLHGFGATLSVSGIETLVGGPGSDVVTVTGGTIRYLASAGGDASLSLAAGTGVDQIVFGAGPGSGPGGGGEPGGRGRGPGADAAATQAFTTVANFQSGTDQMILGGALRQHLDRNDDGVVQSATRTTGTINLATDEVVALGGTVTSLTDTNYASVRTAIGALTNSARGTDEVLVLASDGTSTGAYLVDDRNHDGTVGVSEIKLLGVFKNTSALALGDIAYG